MLTGLHEALTMIGEEGLEVTLARHRRLSSALSAGAVALRFQVFPKATPSPTLVVLTTPDGIDAPALIDRLADGYNTIVAGTHFESLKHRMVRIGTMGAVGDGDILTDLHHLACAMRDLGGRPDEASALAAAAEVLSA